MKTRPTIQTQKSDLSFVTEDEQMNYNLCSASTSESAKKKKWRRKRKDTSQVQILIDEYNQNIAWTKEQVVELSKRTGLSEAQVYKWGWDYKKKLRKQALQYDISEIMCYEFITPRKIDFEMAEVQASYKETYSSLSSIIPTRLLF